MEFKEKYTSASEKEINKKIISDDAYALCEIVDTLIKHFEKARQDSL